MSVRKDPRSPYWQFDFQIKKRRFHGSTGCTSKRDAERYVEKLRRRIALGEDKPIITLDAACESYWNDKGQHEKASKTTDYQLENLCTIIGAGKYLHEITQEDFRRFCAVRRAKVSNASVNREWQLARRVWKHARTGGYDVPLEGTERAIVWKDLRLDEPQERARELSGDEQKRLFAQVPADLLAVVEFAMLSSQRRSAVIGLRRIRVDLDAMRAEVFTKGDRWHKFPLTKRMAEIIATRPVVEGCDFVFTYECTRPSPSRSDRPKRRKGQRYPFSKQGWYRQWRKALTDAGIEDFRFHDLRHTGISRLVRASGNLKLGMKLADHSNVSTTSRYAHVLEDDLRNAMSADESRNSHGKRSTRKPKTAKDSTRKKGMA